MVKSSEVLRLAAELEFHGEYAGRKIADKRLKATLEDIKRQRQYLRLVSWGETIPCSDHAVIALCLAADIAESEGD